MSRMLPLMLFACLLVLSACGVSYHEQSTPSMPGHDVSHYRPNTDPEMPARYTPGYADAQAPIRYDDEMNYEQTDFQLSFRPFPW